VCRLIEQVRVGVVKLSSAQRLTADRLTNGVRPRRGGVRRRSADLSVSLNGLARDATTATYVINIANSGPAGAREVEFKLKVPEAQRVISDEGSFSADVRHISVVCSEPSDTTARLNCMLDRLGAGSSWKVTITVEINEDAGAEASIRVSSSTFDRSRRNNVARIR